jgi:Flp pilus assembly protein TadD
MIILAHSVLDFADMNIPSNVDAESLLRTGKIHVQSGNYEAAFPCLRLALTHAARAASAEDLKTMVIELSLLLCENH